MLNDPTENQLIATAFHRNTMTNSEGGTDDEEFRVAAVVDRVNTTMQVWMGMTMGCAQCHTHKYDPITQEEYYRFFAILNQTEEDHIIASNATMTFVFDVVVYLVIYLVVIDCNLLKLTHPKIRIDLKVEFIIR